MRKIMMLAGAAALALSVTAAFAQDAGKGKAKTPAAPRTAISIECSKQADAKGLHGKERKKFRSACKRNLAKAK
jgi:predicted outer membrane protein